jgi:protein-lysine N-methyltransferase EEF2KMT
MTHLSLALSKPIPSEAEALQRKDYINFTIPAHVDGNEHNAPEEEASQNIITLLESRSLISGSGTTGLRTWEAALHLGQYLCTDKHMIYGRRILELGAGTGYLSILCAKYLGANHVIASDGSDDVINNLPDNLFLNGLQESAAIKIMDLKWGYALVGTEEAAWNGGTSIDMIIGADITYDQAIMPALLATINELFTLFPSAEVLIAATQRNEITFASFLNLAKLAGLKVDDIHFPVPKREEQMGPFYDDNVPIRICKIAKT